MKTLYLELAMGAAGDMLCAALLDLLPAAERESALEQMNRAGIPGVRVEAQQVQSCGVVGLHVHVYVNGEEEAPGDADMPAHGHGHAHGAHAHGAHAHTSARDISALIEGLDLPSAVKADAVAVYDLIAQAESSVHDRPVDCVHLHEVGALDAVADVAFASLLFHLIAPESIVASPVALGGGHVHAAHGILPVPAPATACLLEGVPSRGGPVDSELCTPTGAALVRHFATAFGPQLAMTMEATGAGVGTKVFPDRPNIVRAFYGEDLEETLGKGAAGAAGATEAGARSEVAPERLCEFRCTIDDMTGEDIAFAIERLFAAGARDAFIVPITMKKGRPGTLIEVLCAPTERESVLSTLFRHTSTLGVREYFPDRHPLERRMEKRETAHGPVSVKVSEGFGAHHEKPEFEDLAQIAREQGVSLADLRREIVGS